MGLRPTNRDEKTVGQALGGALCAQRPLRPPGRTFNSLRWVFDCARVLQDPPFGERSAPTAQVLVCDVGVFAPTALEARRSRITGAGGPLGCFAKGKFCIIRGRPVNKGLGMLQISSAKWTA
jgi:hypothetical protein